MDCSVRPKSSLDHPGSGTFVQHTSQVRLASYSTRETSSTTGVARKRVRGALMMTLSVSS
jgi:hypothetical protein